MEGGIYTIKYKKVGEIVILSVCNSFLKLTGCCLIFFFQNFILLKKINRGKENAETYLSLSWSPFSTGKEQIVKREMSGNRMIRVNTIVCVW